MAADEADSFAALLRQHRLHAGLTQEALAERAGFSLRGLSDLERGARRAPYPDTVKRLADALQLDAPQRSRLLASTRRTAASTSKRSRTPGLPTALTSFVGRQRELVEVRRLLATTRLVTLTGTGGIGKTRLALEVASHLEAEGVTDVALVELAALADPSLVPDAVAAGLGIRTHPAQQPLEALIDALRPRRLLLVMDNCEHLAGACGELADRLLRACPMLTVLTTSREVLGVTGEVTWRVPPLSLVSPDDAVGPDWLEHAEAAQLFTARAAAACSSFALTQANAPDVAQLCFRLDGIPLALELAAARLRSLSLHELVQRLDDALRLLNQGSRVAAPRQQTLRSTLDWSYRLLSESEQVMFRRLAVFAGSWTLAAAEVVCPDAQLARDEVVVDLVSQLVDKSLVLKEDAASGEARYRLLETVRQYGQEHLHASGEAAEVHARHATFFGELAARAQPELWGTAVGDWRLTFGDDYDNFRAALRWLINRGEVAAAQRLGSMLARFWQMGNYLHEGRGWLAELLKLPSVSQPEHAQALLAAGLLAVYQADYATGSAYLEEGARICQAIEDDAGLAQALFTLGLLAWARGEIPRARSLAEAGFEASQRAEHPALQSLNLFVGAVVAMDAAEYATARALADEAFRLASGAGYARGMAMARAALGGTSYWQGEPAAARALLEEALTLFRTAEFPVGVAWALGLLAQAMAAQGNTRQARSLLAESSVLVQQLGMQAWLPTLLDGFAEVAALEEDPHAAVRLAGAAAGLRQRLAFPITPAAHAHLDGWLAPTLDRLGAEGAVEWGSGLAMAPAEALHWALERHSPGGPGEAKP